MSTRVFYFFALIFIGVVVLLLFWNKDNDKKTGYVQIEKLFDEFDLKKELEKTYKVYREKEKNKLDSLTVVIKGLDAKFSSNEKWTEDEFLKYKLNRENYENRIKDFEMNCQKMMDDFDAQIKNQMNQYVMEFGKENNYKFIYGNSDGSLMYADSSMNITNEVLKFINKKYSGK